MKKIQKHKYKIIVAVLLTALLAFTYWWGGNSPDLRGWTPQNADNTHMTAEEKEKSAEEIASNKQTQKTEKMQEPEPLKQDDKPAVTPLPQKEKDALTCTLSVRCDTILKNISYLEQEKVDIIPPAGIIYAEKEVRFNEGESVFDVLLREMKENKIHFEYVNTPVSNSAYIEGIGNIYEFDCGELSGWMYKVNGQFPDYGCSLYILSKGDKIEWVYTCNMGYDVGSRN